MLEEVLRLIDVFWEERLIEHIVHPGDRMKKQMKISTCGGLMKKIHEYMQMIVAKSFEIAALDVKGAKNNSIFGDVTNKNEDSKRVIKKIYDRYVEVVIEGSFKYFQKVCNTLGVLQPPYMTAIDVEEWYHECLVEEEMKECC